MYQANKSSEPRFAVEPESDISSQQAEFAKNVVEHIRTIHFSIVTLCFVMLTAIGLSQTSVASRALTQLKIIRLGMQDPNWQGLIERAARNVLKDAPREGEFVRFAQIVASTEKPITISALSNQPLMYDVRIDGPILGLAFLSMSAADLACKKNELPDQNPSNLKQFTSLWNASALIAAVSVDAVKLSGKSVLVSVSDEIDPKKEEKLNAAMDTKATPMQRSISFSKESPSTQVYFDNEFEWCAIPSKNALVGTSPSVILANTGSPAGQFNARIALRAQSAVLRGRPLLGELLGQPPDLPFEVAFPQLSEMAEGLDGLSWADLERSIQAEIKRSGGQVEIFGAKLPSEVIGTWGIFALLCAQCYFLIHVRGALRNDVSVVQSVVPSVFKYIDDRLAVIVAAATTIVLPLATVIRVLAWANYQGDSGRVFPNGNWLSLAMGVASFIISAAVASTMLQLFRRDRPILRSLGDPVL